jgi:hypothetical protein
MLLFPSARFQKRHANVQRTPPGAPPTPPATLVLVSASYDENVAVLTLTFDRAIDASGLSAAQITVYDGSFNSDAYAGSGAAMILSPTTIQIALVITGPASVAPVTMTASALSGIVAVHDGGTWAGVSELGLPYDG